MNSVLYLFSTTTLLFTSVLLYEAGESTVLVIFKPPFKSEFVLIQTNVTFMQNNAKEFVHFCLSTFYFLTAIEIPLLPLGFGPLWLPWQPVNWLAG